MRIADLWFHFKFCLAKERVNTATARLAQNTLIEAARVIQAAVENADANCVDNELSDRCRRLAGALFATYGPERRGARLFVLAKQRARLHAIHDAARNISAAMASELDDDRDLA